MFTTNNLLFTWSFKRICPISIVISINPFAFNSYYLFIPAASNASSSTSSNDSLNSFSWVQSNWLQQQVNSCIFNRRKRRKRFTIEKGETKKNHFKKLKYEWRLFQPSMQPPLIHANVSTLFNQYLLLLLLF